MNEVLLHQLAIDFCCSESQAASRENVFTEYEKRPGRRIFREGECFLKAAVFQGKLLFSGKAELISWAEDRYKNTNGAWFMDGKSLCDFSNGLRPFGCRLAQAHPFFIAETKSEVDTGDFEIRRYIGTELEQFRGDKRFEEAFAFEELPKDELGIAAFCKGSLAGMAGATSDSRAMWQIGIDVLPEARGRGIGPMLVALLKNEILDRGVLPFYGTSMSHIVSQNTALRAGFRPAWAELCCEKVESAEGEKRKTT